MTGRSLGSASLYRTYFFRRRRLLLCVSIFFVVWLSGLYQHLLTTSFDRFTWSAPGVDVYNETKRLLAGESVRVPFANNWKAFQTIAVPRCPKETEESPAYSLLIIVKSAVANSRNRDVIRETWGRPHVVDDFSVRTVFVVGRFVGTKEQLSMGIAVDREAELHGDLLIADMIDTYRNNTAKFAYSISFAFSSPAGCRRADFVLLIDDDYMLSTHNLVRLLDEKSAQEQLYLGWRFDTSPFRFFFHKHYVSLEQYPFDRYPPYVTAGCVLMSRLTVDHFYHAIQLVQFYDMDDVYAGILAHLLRIEPTHDERFVFWTRKISHDDWMHAQVISAHGFSPEMLEAQFPLVRFVAPG